MKTAESTTSPVSSSAMMESSVRFPFPPSSTMNLIDVPPKSIFSGRSSRYFFVSSSVSSLAVTFATVSAVEVVSFESLTLLSEHDANEETSIAATSIRQSFFFIADKAPYGFLSVFRDILLVNIS